MGRRRAGSAALLAGVVIAVVLASATTAAPAGDSGKIASLRSQASALGEHAHHALLDLYALDSSLHDAQARLGSLQTRMARLRDKRRLLAQQLSATRGTLATSQRSLARHLRALYEQGDADPLAVMLGASSLDDAMTELDDLTRVADQSGAMVDVATAAHARLDHIASALAAERARLRAAVASARRAANELLSARAERVDFIARLRGEQKLAAQQISDLETAAQHVEKKAASIQVDAAPPAADPADAAPGVPAPSTTPSGSTITVTSTGYSLSGHTSTGVPVGWGVVAVDPAVIPLGTRLTIPGYGEGVAADTGVTGSSIDLWFPTPTEAHAWGRRTVTITLH